MGRVTERRRVLRIRDGAVSARADTLVAEEPLEIRLNGKPLAITMRTPGDDFALAVGFLVSEGVLADASELASVVYCAGATADGSNTYNVVDVRLAEGVVLPDISLERNVYTSSSCGLCGKASLDAVRTKTRHPLTGQDGVRLSPAQLSVLPDRLRAAQQVFDRTGGLHGAALFTPEGELVDLREDVGRHNAVDKVVGRALQQGRLPLGDSVLLVSGRASFELVQKAVMAGIPMLAAVSAPSSLAVELARESGMTLVGFLRGTSMNVYAGEERIALPVDAAERRPGGQAAPGPATGTGSATASGSRERRLAMTAQTISCIWWKSISGSTASEACEAKSTVAIGSPAASDFFEPANWMAIRSARPKPIRAAPYQVSESITASRTASAASSASSRGQVTCCQMPATTPWLKAV